MKPEILLASRILNSTWLVEPGRSPLEEFSLSLAIALRPLSSTLTPSA